MFPRSLKLLEGLLSGRIAWDQCTYEQTAHSYDQLKGSNIYSMCERVCFNIYLICASIIQTSVALKCSCLDPTHVH